MAFKASVNCHIFIEYLSLLIISYRKYRKYIITIINIPLKYNTELKSVLHFEFHSLFKVGLILEGISTLVSSEDGTKVKIFKICKDLCIEIHNLFLQKFKILIGNRKSVHSLQSKSILYNSCYALAWKAKNTFINAH